MRALLRAACGASGDGVRGGTSNAPHGEGVRAGASCGTRGEGTRGAGACGTGASTPAPPTGLVTAVAAVTSAAAASVVSGASLRAWTTGLDSMAATASSAAAVSSSSPPRAFAAPSLAVAADDSPIASLRLPAPTAWLVGKVAVAGARVDGPGGERRTSVANAAAGLGVARSCRLRPSGVSFESLLSLRPSSCGSAPTASGALPQEASWARERTSGSTGSLPSGLAHTELRGDVGGDLSDFRAFAAK
eukprot:7387909-Prymnesium_polylepis.2